MNQEPLAPSFVQPRVLKRVAVGVCVVAAVVGVVVGVVQGTTLWGWVGIGVRVGLVAMLGAAWVWAAQRLARVGRTVRSERTPLVQALSSVLGMVFFYLAASIMMSGATGRFGAVFFGQMIMFTAMFFGMSLVAGGWARRVGEAMHCPQCEYEFGFADERDAPIRCPECGTGWLGRLVKGRRARSGRLMAAGLVIAALGLAASSPVFYIHRIVPYLPTMALYAMVYVSPVGNEAAWKEMQTRSLSDEWARRLEQRVLGERADWSFHDGGGRWMEARMAAGGVDDATRERLFREGFVAELIGPASVRAGEEFEVRLRVRRASDAGSLRLIVMFEGYSVGMGPFVGRQAEELWGHDLRPGSFRSHSDVFVQRVRAEGVRPGESLRVQAVYWVMYVTGFDRSHWQRDGTPTRPGKAVWFERVELEGEVRVE